LSVANCLSTKHEKKNKKCNKLDILLPITGAARSKVWVCGHSLSGFAGLNPGLVLDNPSLVCVVQIGASATGLSLVQGCPTKDVRVIEPGQAQR
jgi:hypothetical protein